MFNKVSSREAVRRDLRDITNFGHVKHSWHTQRGSGVSHQPRVQECRSEQHTECQPEGQAAPKDAPSRNVLQGLPQPNTGSAETQPSQNT